MRGIRPGRVLEGTLIGIVLSSCVVSVLGRSEQAVRSWFDRTQDLRLVRDDLKPAAVVWLLLAPRTCPPSSRSVSCRWPWPSPCAPEVKMPALTGFRHRHANLQGRSVPLRLHHRACGASVHAVSSGTTPKAARQRGNPHDRPRLHGYGVVRLIMAVVAAILDPGVYFAITPTSAGRGGGGADLSWGPQYQVTVEQMALAAGWDCRRCSHAPAEHRAGRWAWPASSAPPSVADDEFWYRFAIMFGCCSFSPRWTGTRVGRFMLRIWASISGRFRRRPTLTVLASLIFRRHEDTLWQGVTDLGGHPFPVAAVRISTSCWPASR